MTNGRTVNGRALNSTSAPGDGGVTLRAVVATLDSTVAEVLDAPVGAEVMVSSVALVDPDDLMAETGVHFPMRHLYLHVGIDEPAAVRWADAALELPQSSRPRAVLSKIALESDAFRLAARRAGIAVVAIHPRARWDHVFPVVRDMLLRNGHRGDPDPDLIAADTDLFGLAAMVAENTRGLVTIEDAHSHVLAYSASDGSADELRTLSILGREGPPEYLRALADWGVFDRVRRSDEVVDIPAHDELGTRRRLVIGVHQPADVGARRVLGSIWVQHGSRPLSPDAADVLRGAAAMASRIIARVSGAPSAEGLLIQRLFGARGGDVDIRSVVSSLGIPEVEPCAVVAFAHVAGESTAPDLTSSANVLRLHASSFQRDAVVSVIDDRVYVLVPRHRSAAAVTSWVRGLVEKVEHQRSLTVRAAIAVPVVDLRGVAAARREVDRVLDAVPSIAGDRVATLAESRTSVLLAEALALIAARPELRDPRVDQLRGYDAANSTDMCASASAFLAAHGDVRAAAAGLAVHPNTLRYRLRRVEEIAGIDLSDARDRLLLEIQLAIGGPGSE